jgi:hypothetical protein
VGVIASSKTEASPVCVRSLADSFGRKEVRILRPRERADVLGSSSRVTIGGMKRCQKDFMIDS